MATRIKSNFWVIQIGRYLIPLICLVLAYHMLIPQIAAPEKSYKLFQQMTLWVVMLAVIAQVISILGSGYLLQAIVHTSGGKLGLFLGTSIVLAAASLGMVLGGLIGTATATYRWIQKQGIKSEIAGLAGTIPGFFNISVLAIVSVAGIAHLLLVHELSNIQAVSFALILLMLISLVSLSIWGYHNQHKLIHLSHYLGMRWARIRRKIYNPDRMEEKLGELFQSWDLLVAGGWHGPALGATINLVFDMLTLYLLFIAAGNPVSPAILLTGYGLPLILGKMAFIIPGGVGIIEGSMIALYSGLGVPGSIALVVVLTYRMLSFWLPLLLGFPIIWILQSRVQGGIIKPAENNIPR
ncbi:MAG: YbhN family protein [Anaerolineales bacterium]|jgi:hypothetical protein